MAQPVVTFCQFNPRAVLPTALPPFLNHTECAVPFLSYSLCVLRSLNETACNSQAMRPNVTATTAIQGTACSVDSKLVPLINRAIAVVQSRNTTVPYTRKVNGLPCTSTPAAVFSACQGLDVNVAVNSSGLFCPSLACAVAYTSYAACFLASSPCTAPTASVKYPACPDASHQVQTFLSVCSAAVASGSFPGYLRAPSPPPTGCTTTSAALFQQYVQPTLVTPACTLPNLYGPLASTAQSNCYFSPLVAASPPLSSTCSVSCAYWLSSFLSCQQRLVTSAVNFTLVADANLTSSQLQVSPVVQAAFAPSALCSGAQSCPSDRHLVPYVSTCLATLQTLPLLSCPAKVDGLLCTATPAAVMDTCLGLNVNNVATAAVVSSYTCPSLSCAVAYARYAVCYLRQTPCRAGATSANGTTAACPDATGQVSTFLSTCYQAVLRNSFTGYLLPPPQVAPPCNVTAISLFQAAVPSTSVIAGHTPCTAATLFTAFAPAVSQLCYFNPLVTSAPTYSSQCSVGCAYALSFYLSCYAKVANASAAALVRAANMSSKGTPPVVVFPLQYRNTTIVNGSLSCGLAQACSTPANPVLQAYAATCLTALQATTKVCVSPPAPVVIVPAPTANLTAFTSYTCAPYLPAVSTTCSTNLNLPIVGATLSARFPIGLFSRECARAVAQYAVCYFNAQPPTNSTGSCCSLNQDVVILAKAAIAALSNSTIVNVNPPTLSQVSVAGVRCDTVAPQLLRACGVRLVGGEVLVIPGVVNCSLTCARLFTEYSACRLRTTAVCVGRTYSVSAGQSVTIPAYPSFPYVQASTNASVGQGSCVDVDGSVWSFLSFCNRTLTGAILAPPVLSSSAMPSSSSFPSSSRFSSSLVSSSTRVSSSPAPTSAAFVTSSSPLPTYPFSIQLNLVGADFSVSITATVVCQHTGGPLYAPNSIYTVVQMQGTRVYSSSSLNVTSAITAVAPPGGLGNNDNSFYPTAAVVLNQDGLDYSLSPPAPLGGVAGAFDILNLFSSDGKYREEGSSGTAEAVVASTIAIVPLFATQSSSSAFSSSSLTSSPAQRSSSAPSVTSSSLTLLSSTMRLLTSWRFSSSSSPAAAPPLITGSAPPFGPNSGGTVVTITGSNLPLNATYQCQFQLPSVNLTTPATLTGTTTLTCVAPSILPIVPVGSAAALLRVLLSSAAVAGDSPVPVLSSSTFQLLYYGNCVELGSCSGHGSCQLGSCSCTDNYRGSNCSIASFPPVLTALSDLSRPFSLYDSQSLVLTFAASGSGSLFSSFVASDDAVAANATFTASRANGSLFTFVWSAPTASFLPYTVNVTVSSSLGSSTASFTVLVAASLSVHLAVSSPVKLFNSSIAQSQLTAGITLTGYATPAASGLSVSVSRQVVTLYIDHAGSRRVLQTRTSTSGAISVQFFPYSTDVGYFEVRSSGNATVQDSFNLLLMTASPTQTDTSVTALPFQRLTFVICRVSNPSAVEYSGLVAQAAELELEVHQAQLQGYTLFFSADLANGSAAVSNTTTLPAFSSVNLLATLAFPSTVHYYADGITVYMQAAPFVLLNVLWRLSVQPPYPVLSVSPSFSSLVVSQQTVTSLTEQLTNSGSALSGVIFVSCPAASAGQPTLSFSSPAPIAVPLDAALVAALQSLSLVPADASASYLTQVVQPLLLPGLASGASVPLSSTVVAGPYVPEAIFTSSCVLSSIDVNRQVVEAQGGFTVRLTVRSGSLVNVTFQVSDELTYFNTSQPYLAGATITVTQLGISQTVRTDGAGMATLIGLPIGGYSVVVQALDHQGVSYTIVVTRNTALQSVFLKYTPVSYIFTVTPSTISDVITVVIGATFNTHVPVPIVTLSPNVISWADLESGLVDNIPFVLTNLGLIEALNVTITLTHPDLNFIFPINPLPLLPANSSVQIPTQVVRAVDSPSTRRRLLATHVNCVFYVTYIEPCPSTPTQTVTTAAQITNSVCSVTGDGGGVGSYGYGLWGGGGGYGGGLYASSGVVYTQTFVFNTQTCHKDDCGQDFAICMAKFAGNLALDAALKEYNLLQGAIGSLGKKMAKLAKSVYDALRDLHCDSVTSCAVSALTLAGIALAAVAIGLLAISGLLAIEAAIAAATAELALDAEILAELSAEAKALSKEIDFLKKANDVNVCIYKYDDCIAKRGGGGGGGHRRLLQMSGDGTETPRSLRPHRRVFHQSDDRGFRQCGLLQPVQPQCGSGC